MVRSLNAASPLKFVNTSMHGVSHPAMVQAFERYKLKPFIPVEEQRSPDPEFSTVKFPNPEEKGICPRAYWFIHVFNIPSHSGALVSLGNTNEVAGRALTQVFKDHALSTADKHQAHYVLAQDPDADRFSAAERGLVDFVVITAHFTVSVLALSSGCIILVPALVR
jgi:phosphomannomutase